VTVDWKARAAAVGVRAGARSTEIEANRTLPRDIVDELVEAELLKLFVPAALGGAEVSPLDGLTVTEELAYHDGSTGWCQMIAMTTGMLGGFLAAEHAQTIFAPPGAIAGGLAAPMGEAQAADDGGLIVNGRWAWGSGTRHCTWIGGGTRLPTGGSAFVFFDPADVELLDTWRVAGLKGTGSTDYAVTDLHVPEGRWVQVGVSAPTADGPLYRFSVFGLLAVGVCSVALGLARRAVDELVELAVVKAPQGSTRPLAERAPVQADVAAAEAAVRSAKCFLEDVVGDAWDAVVAGGVVSDEQRRSIRLATTHATAESARAVDLMYTAGGGAAIYDDSALQRVFRDVHVATQHAMVAPRTRELVGRMRLGLDTHTGQL
jgi:alkylation response protein AidB-like acyl-CoA dehydrogenase